MYRNTAGTLKVFAFNRTTNAPVVGDAVQITCRVSLNGGARVTLADPNPTEMEDGYYLFDVSAAETNGITADFYPESASANVQVIPVEHSRYLSLEQQIADKTNTITAGKVSYAGPVTAKGTVDQIVIGDDYLVAHGTAFVWTISAIPGMSPGAVTVHFGGTNGTHPFAVTGTAADIGSGKWSLTCEMPRATSGGLVPGEYRYSVAVHNAAGVELTRVYYDDPFVAVEKFTP
jgi:hypothetical protein